MHERNSRDVHAIFSKLRSSPSTINTKFISILNDPSSHTSFIINISYLFSSPFHAYSFPISPIFFSYYFPWEKPLLVDHLEKEFAKEQLRELEEAITIDLRRLVEIIKVFSSLFFKFVLSYSTCLQFFFYVFPLMMMT